jgi:hypothetical protein
VSYAAIHASDGKPPNGLRALLPLSSMRGDLSHRGTAGRSRRPWIPGAFPERLSATARVWRISNAPRFYSQRNGEYVYDVTVTKDETVSRVAQMQIWMGQTFQSPARPDQNGSCLDDNRLR